MCTPPRNITDWVPDIRAGQGIRQPVGSGRARPGLRNGGQGPGDPGAGPGPGGVPGGDIPAEGGAPAAHSGSRLNFACFLNR